MKKCFYTVLIGKYDNIPKPTRFSGWDSVIFTDQNIVNSKWTKIVKVPSSDRPDIDSRDYKWRSHLHLPEYDLVCYYDANMIIKKAIEPKPFRILHYKRKNLREEGDALNRQLHRCSIESVEHQLSEFKKSGFKDDRNLWLNGFQCRDNKSKEEIELSELVWNLCNKYTPRDQLALPYAMWVTGYIPQNIKGVQFFNSVISLTYHKNRKPKIHE
jgi:hypothetical protein